MLALSLRLDLARGAEEILDAWFSRPSPMRRCANVEHVDEYASRTLRSWQDRPPALKSRSVRDRTLHSILEAFTADAAAS